MWGIEIQLASGAQVPGVIFDDLQVYAHEPIADCFASVADLIANQPGCSIQPIGPVVPVDLARQELEREFQESWGRIGEQEKMLKRNYKQMKASLTRFDALVAEAA